MKGSPAAAAGLQPKDIIIAIDGDDMTGIPGDLVLNHILGPAGTALTLTIRRGDEVFDVTLNRASSSFQLLKTKCSLIKLHI